MTTWFNPDTLKVKGSLARIRAGAVGSAQIDMYLFTQVSLPEDDELDVLHIGELIARGGIARGPYSRNVDVHHEGNETYLTTDDFDPIEYWNDPQKVRLLPQAPWVKNDEPCQVAAMALVDPTSQEILLLTTDVNGYLAENDMLYPARQHFESLKMDLRPIMSWDRNSVVLREFLVAHEPPMYESSHTQHVWLYPQRVNMIANPRIQKDLSTKKLPYWRYNQTAFLPLVIKQRSSGNARWMSHETAAVLVSTGQPPVNSMGHLREVYWYDDSTGALWEYDIKSAPKLWRPSTMLPLSDTTPFSANEFRYDLDALKKLIGAQGVTPDVFQPDANGIITIESNVMAKSSDLWTVQFKARGLGTLKVGLVYWTGPDMSVDWGAPGEEWELTPSGWIDINTLRQAIDSDLVQLRIEVQGEALEIDYACVEPGAVLGWPYFDGDTVYGAPGDHRWQGPRGGAYSVWYNNRRVTQASLFESQYIREIPEDVPPPSFPVNGVVGRWGDKKTGEVYSFWAPDGEKKDPLWGPMMQSTWVNPPNNKPAPGGETVTLNLDFASNSQRMPDEIDTMQIDSSISEHRSGAVYRWLPAGTKVASHWDVLFPYDPQVVPEDLAGTTILPYDPDGVTDPWV